MQPDWLGGRRHLRGGWSVQFQQQYLIELPLLYTIRRAVSAGTPVTTWVRTFLKALLDDVKWLDASEEPAHWLHGELYSVMMCFVFYHTL